jgi:hypothetical protein
MLKFSSIINEMVEDELNRLRSVGRIPIDKIETGPYKVFLLKNINAAGWQANYDIALTSDEEDFTSVSAQQDKKTNKEIVEIINSWKNIKIKINDWVDEYGEIRIGSMNEKKTQKYFRILSKSNFKVTNINHLMGGTFFMVSPKTEEEIPSNSD